MLGHQAAGEVVVVPGVVADVARSDGRGARRVAGGGHLHSDVGADHSTAPSLFISAKGSDQQRGRSVIIAFVFIH